MGEITICFTGICTHLSGVIENVPHRVVLIHEEHDVTINGLTIHSHEPYLWLAYGRLVSGTISKSPRRVSMRVANAVGDPPSYDDDYECAIPKLSRLTDARLELNRGVVENRGRPASIYFDVDRGAFTAGAAPRGATAAVLTVETEGEPRLLITPMDGGAASEIELTSGAAFELRNSAVGPRDHHDGDFLLHYKVFQSIAPDARFPTAPPHCPGLRPLPVPDIELGPGCSNSQYP